jgi:hypothetical protein
MAPVVPWIILAEAGIGIIVSEKPNEIQGAMQL